MSRLKFQEYKISKGKIEPINGNVIVNLGQTIPSIQLKIPHLTQDRFHIWSTTDDQTGIDDNLYITFLSKSEINRIGKFRFAKDRRRFIICRGLLRILLSYYLKADAQNLRITRECKGKPILDLKYHNTKMHFNISHSSFHALFAFSWNRRIGVDLELLNAFDDIEQVALNCLTKRELAFCNSVPKKHWAAAFYSCWTRKEAYVKATGDGFQCDPNEVDVLMEAGKKTVSPLVKKNTPKHEFKFLIRDLFALPGYSAAVAVEEKS